MPISTFSSVRKGSKPLVYFKGLLEEAKQLPVGELEKGLEASGFDLPSSPGVRAREIERFKAQLVAHIDQLKPSKPDAPQSHVLLGHIQSQAIPLKVSFHGNGRISILPYPSVHAFYYHEPSFPLAPIKEIDRMAAFEKLTSILERGFSGRDSPNVHVGRTTRKLGLYSEPAWRGKYGTLLTGDSYALHFMGGLEDGYEAGDHEGQDDEVGIYSGFIRQGKVRDLLRVNVGVHPDTPPDLFEQKRKFYRGFFKQYGIPHSIVLLERAHER